MNAVRTSRLLVLRDVSACRTIVSVTKIGCISSNTSYTGGGTKRVLALEEKNRWELLVEVSTFSSGPVTS